MPRLRPLCTLLMLAGCAAATPPTNPQACTIRKAADIPVTFERGFVSAPATIEGKPVRLLIDTGSEISLVTPIAMTVLHLQPDPHRRTTLHGTGGTITTQNALLQSFGIGGMEVLAQSTAVGPLPALRGPALEASGLIGADWLHDFDVELDLLHHRIALYRVEGCVGDYVPWPGRKTAVAAEMLGRGLVVLPVALDGQPVRALLDTGANHSVLSTSAAARIGIAPSTLALDRGGTAMGVDGATLAMRHHRFGQLRIGDAGYPAPPIDIGPLRVAAVDMLLGVDWLRRSRVWIAYSARRVTVQPYLAQTP
jgi:predicted aspartyl protease